MSVNVDITAAEQDPVAWAKAYPFDVPERSYIYAASGSHVLARGAPGAWHAAEVQGDGTRRPLAEALGEDGFAALLQERHAVIACGSNAAPGRLAQKYGALGADSVVPTLRVTVRDHVVVYATNFTAYGSVPATMAHVPGAATEVFVNLLTERQIDIMDATEGGYDRVTLRAGIAELETGERLGEVETYVSHHGGLRHDSGLIALAAVRHAGASLAAMTQVEAQTHAHRLLGAGDTLDGFIRSNIVDPDTRRRRGRTLKAQHALPLNIRASKTRRIDRDD